MIMIIMSQKYLKSVTNSGGWGGGGGGGGSPKQVNQVLKCFIIVTKCPKSEVHMLSEGLIPPL